MALTSEIEAKHANGSVAEDTSQADAEFPTPQFGARVYVADAICTDLPQARQPWLRSLVISHRGHIMPVGGALTIINGVTLVGAIGVAESSRPDQAVLSCRASMAVWENYGH